MNAPIKRILVPVDFSDLSLAAKNAGVDWAERFDAELKLLHVVEVPQQPHEVYVAAGAFSSPWVRTDYPDVPAGEEGREPGGADERTALEREIEARLRELAAECRQTCHTGVRFGHPVEEVLREIEAYQPDLVVLCTHGWTGLRHLVLGSVTERIVRLAKVPVLTLRP